MVCFVRIDGQLQDVKYCVCSSKPQLRSEDGWEPYVERKDILVWRKGHCSKKGLYHYKLYGKFDDVTVWEFLAVQLDLSQYRLGWDSSTARCQEVEVQKRKSSLIIQGDTAGPLARDGHRHTDTSSENNNSEALVYHWEVQYPAFFSNRSKLSSMDVYFLPFIAFSDSIMNFYLHLNMMLRIFI